MPTLNRTYSDKDLIRIYKNHLTKKERSIVDDFFLERALERGGTIATMVASIVSALFAILRRNPLTMNPGTAELIGDLTKKIVRQVARDVCQIVRRHDG